MAFVPWYRYYLAQFLAAVILGMIGFVAVNPFMSNESLFTGPILHWVGFFLPVLPVALLLHFGTVRQASIGAARYLLRVVFGSLVASTLAVVILAFLTIVVTGEFI